MSKRANDVLNEWVLRGYITSEQSLNQKEKYMSYINQSKLDILNYCNLPMNAVMPEGLFYAWVDISWGNSQGINTIEGSGAIKSVSEGDTTITYDVGTTVVNNNNTTINCKEILNKYRRFKW